MSEQLHNNPEIPVFSHPRYIEGSPENTETLVSFSHGLAEFQAQHPQILGATIFGSRLKGTAREDSDVDCRILADADYLEQHGAKATITEEGDVEWGDNGSFVYELEEKISKDIATNTNKDWLTIRRGIYIEPMSKKLIHEHLQKFLQNRQASIDTLAAINAWSFGGNKGPRPTGPPLIDIGSSVPALFAPDLIPGLDKYRRLVVEELSSAGRLGAITWANIMKQVQFGEGHVDTRNPYYYPQDLDQAKQWYPPEASF